MNRDVMGRQMFRNGGPVYMQDGGMAPMPMDQGAMPMDQGAMPPPMPAPMMPPQDIEAEAARMAQEQMDPAMMEQLLGGYAQSLGGMENEGDYAAVIDGIRGNSLPMAGRYEELAGLVGPEDAQQTPESVLALVQPTLMLAEAEASGVDEGIGGLAPAIMDTPIEGPMAEGIMSTVGAAGPAPDAMMPPMGGPAPVNFNRGGAVQYFSAGGPVQYFENGGETAGQANAPYAVDPRLQELYGQNQAFYGQLVDPRQQEAALEEQTRMTKAGILFDIAQGALSFAGRKEGNMSTGERLAQSFSPVIGNIGQRAAGLSEFKQGQAAEKRKINMLSAQAAQSQFDAFRVKKDEPADPSNLSRITYKDENGDDVFIDGPNTVYQFNKILKEHPDAKMTAIPKTADLVKSGWVSLFPIGGGKPVPVNLATPEGRDKQNELMATENYSLTKPDNDFTVYYDNTGEGRRPKVLDTTTSEGLAEARKLVESGGWSETEPKRPDPYSLKQVTFTRPVTIDGETYKTGDSMYLDQEQLVKYANAYKEYVPAQQPDQYNLTQVTFTRPVTIGGETYKVGDSTNLNEEQLAEYANSYKEYVPAQQPDQYNLTEVTFTRPVTIDGETYKVGDSTNLNEEQLVKYANSYTEKGVAFGNDVLAILNNPELLKGYEEGTLTEDQDLTVELALNQYTAPKQAYNVETGTFESKPGGKLPAKWAAADAIRRPKADQTVGTSPEHFNENGTVNFDSFKGHPTTIVGGVDLTAGTGFMSGIMRGLNAFAGPLGEFGMGTGTAGEKGLIVAKASKQLDSLARQTLLLVRGGVDGRLFASDLTMLKEAVGKFEAKAWNSDQDALGQLKASRNELATFYQAATGVLEDPSSFDRKQIMAARALHGPYEALLGEYTAAITTYEESLAAKGSTTEVGQTAPAASKAERMLRNVKRL